jgi:hypothetical protein
VPTPDKNWVVLFTNGDAEAVRNATGIEDVRPLSRLEKNYRLLSPTIAIGASRRFAAGRWPERFRKRGGAITKCSMATIHAFSDCAWPSRRASNFLIV